MPFVSGQWNAICDRCGFKKKSGAMKVEWNGLRVCEQCYEPRQPQDMVRARVDKQTVPWTRSEGADEFITTPVSRDDL